ncbi:hypothetical protein DRE_04214 [Drechslerella stenobrocha 248]|uniref:Uncharacterized protein n=1 Tax=Drechslerella stenobrocha 248 TaxID=1043628 RepID=W7HR65_9PEZI|nr:hypothetical protein DRE_04214 [Drechslerella stenobrocha 248]
MEMEQQWEAPRDELLEQLANLLNELQAHEEGLTGTFDLLDHLDGTRRAIDRLSAVITDKYNNPSSIEYFSPAVTRPLSTATDASNSSSENSLDSHLTHISSPITLISDYDDDLHHRRRLLDEDEELIGRSLIPDLDGTDDDGEDQNDRLERLSLLLTSVLQEANDAIKDYEAIEEDPEEEEIIEQGEPTTRCSSRLSTNASTLIGRVSSPVDKSPKMPVYALPALQSHETVLPAALQPPTAPPTPPLYPDMNELLPSPDQLSVSSLTSSAETVRPSPATPRPERVVHEDISADDTLVTDLLVDEILGGSGDSKELSLDYLLGDYLNEVIMDVRRNEFVGARFWIFLISVMGMWTWMFVTDSVNTFVGNLVCGCKNAA